jgi:hypothetical protein
MAVVLAWGFLNTAVWSFVVMVLKMRRGELNGFCGMTPPLALCAMRMRDMTLRLNVHEKTD